MTYPAIHSLIAELIAAGKRLDARRLLAGTEGNLSARLSDGSILITASGRFKGRLAEDDFVIVDPRTGQVKDHPETAEQAAIEATSTADSSTATGPGMSSEGATHLAIYRLREDVRAVIHAHPLHCIALSARGESLEAVPLAEAAYGFGSVPTCRFAVPGTGEGAAAVEQWIGQRDALLLDLHGAVTVGRTIDEALARMEMLEAVAEVVLLAGGVGQMKQLELDQVDRVVEAARRARLTRPEALEAWRDRLVRR